METSPAELADPKCSIVVPCFNEEASIENTVLQLLEIIGTDSAYEIIVVDDGSTDRSPEFISTLVSESPIIKAVRHERTGGYGAALKSGIRKARASLIAITDADGTYPNQVIPDLIESLLQNDLDMVVGSRTGERVSYPMIRKIPKVFLKKYASWLARREIPDLNSGLRVFRKAAVDRFVNILPNGFSFTTTITLAMMTNNYEVRFHPINYSDRVGKSKIRPIRDTINFIQLMVRTGMYFAPIRVFAPIGLILFIASILSMGYDFFVANNLSEKTLILSMASINVVMFALLADMIDKRSAR